MNGVMIQGTASNVGKSLLVTALCRLAANLGYQVAPFKSQNMTTYTQLLDDGSEISRSQVTQAEAAQQRPSVWMNPLVLKPQIEQAADTVLLGESIGAVDGYDYRDRYYKAGLSTIKQSLSELDDGYDAIVAEGAGSPVEVNLRDRDLVNMTVAELANIPVILVADIERGGVFASIVGTLELLGPQERERVQGIIINKFQGDPGSFADGVQWIENYTGVPVLGVIPKVAHQIEGEDVLAEEVESDSNDTDRYDDVTEKLCRHLDWRKVMTLMTGWGSS